MKTKNELITLSVIIIFSILPPRTIAQQDSTLFIDSAIESWEAQTEDLEDAENVSEDLLERIEEMRNGTRPNLNDLSYEAAVNMLQLTDYQYYQLQLYIEEFGQLYSIYEIPAIEGFSEEELRRLAGGAGETHAAAIP